MNKETKATESMQRVLPHFSSPKIFAVARQEVFDISEKATMDEPAQQEVLAAIVFSAAALEAFFNELYELATLHTAVPLGRKPQTFDLPPAVETWCQLLPSFNRTKDELTAKLKLTHWIFTGKPLDMGMEKTQHFSRLLQLRNSLVHIQPTTGYYDPDTNKIVLDKPSDLANFLVAKRLIRPPENHIWAADVSTLAFGIWACNTARSIIEMVLGILPESTFAEEARNAFRLPMREEKPAGKRGERPV